MTHLVVDVLEPVHIGGIKQWIRIRAADAAKPVLLLMQQGPGLPIINEVAAFEKLELERQFTVVYWDQRGTGLSARPLRKSGRFEISVAQMVSDTVEMLQTLYDRFGGKTLIAGFSFGATFAAYAAAQRPDLVRGLVAVGMDIEVAAAGRHMYEFVRKAAAERGNHRAMRQLVAIGPPPHVTPKQFGTRARWAANFGGVTRDASFIRLTRTLLASLVRSRDYSLADLVRAVNGIRASQKALLPELATTDLLETMPRLDVPLVLVQGCLDKVAPGVVAQRFYEAVSAPSKRLVWCERSAHTPQFDEPARFRDVLYDLREQPAVGRPRLA